MSRSMKTRAPVEDAMAAERAVGGVVGGVSFEGGVL